MTTSTIEQISRVTETIECTAGHPWNLKKDDSTIRVRHHDVEEVDDQRDGYPGGDIVTYRCKNCGHQWEAELPQ